MDDRSLLRLSGSAAIAGGAVRVALAFVTWRPNVAWLEAAAFGIDVALLFGLLGIYLAERAALGRFGLAAFALAETGIASIVGPDTVAFGIDTYQAGVVVISLALSLLGAQMLRRHAGSRVAAISWIASTVAGLAGGAIGRPEIGFLIGGILFGVGFVAGGARLVGNR
jgi:hypothetical protein